MLLAVAAQAAFMNVPEPVVGTSPLRFKSSEEAVDHFMNGWHPESDADQGDAAYAAVRLSFEEHRKVAASNCDKLSHATESPGVRRFFREWPSASMRQAVGSR